MRSTDSRQIDRARTLRSEQSPPEVVLWSHLRGRRLKGLKFRRQMPLGPFVVDFCCPEAMLVIEIDSKYHEGRQDQDAACDRDLIARGYRVLRITAGDVASNLDGVLNTMARIAMERTEDG